MKMKKDDKKERNGIKCTSNNQSRMELVKRVIVETAAKKRCQLRIWLQGTVPAGSLPVKDEEAEAVVTGRLQCLKKKMMMNSRRQ